MMRRRYHRAFRYIALLCLCVAVCSVFFVLSGKRRVPPHQRLDLRLDLPREMDDRYFIVKQYFQKLQPQLQTKHYTDDESVYARRNQHVKNYCQARGVNVTIDEHHIRNVSWYLEHQKLFFCGEAKAGSTFWRRVLEVVRRQDRHFKSPFQLSYWDFMASNARLSSRAPVQWILQYALKFVFVRNPYMRLFSAYVDKALAPNNYFWYMGQEAIRQFRPSGSGNSSGCDVTFSEFVKYLNTIDSRDFEKHVRPVAYTCDACQIKYDVIGKVETFQTDVRHVLRKAGELGKSITFKDMSLEYKVDYIIDSVARMFELKGFWSEYISVHAGHQRLWRQLQISGIIDKSDIFPLSESQSANATMVDLINIVLSAFTRSSEDARLNKKEAYLQAYSTLTLEDMETLRKHYLVDFQMFGYDDRPYELFNRERKYVGDFDYFDVLTIK